MRLAGHVARLRERRCACAGFCLRERDHFEDLVVGGSVMDLPGEDCIWFGIRTSGRLSCTL